MRAQNFSSVKHFGHVEEVTPPLTFSSVVPDGDRLYACIKMLKQGHTVESLNKVFKGQSGERLIARAVKLKDKIENGLAYLGRRSAGRCGFIQRQRIMDTTVDPPVMKGTKIVLTLKGKAQVESYTRWAKGFFPKDQLSVFVEKYKHKLLGNQLFWVRTDVRQKKENERDFGMELFADLIKPFQANEFNATVDVAKNFLYALEDDEELKNAVQDLEVTMGKLFPLVDENIAEELSELNEIEEGMMALQGEDDEDEADLVERYIGGAVLSQNALVRDQFLSQLRKASKSKMTMQQLWDYILRPLVDHYSNRVFGSNATGYDLGPTEAELAVIKDSFPYDNVVTQESYFTNVKTIEEDKVVGRDEEGNLVSETIDREHREVRTTYHNHDSGIQPTLENVDNLREWRKRMVFALLAMPAAKEKVNGPEYRKVLADHFDLKLWAAYYKTCREEGKEFDPKEFEKYKAQQYMDYVV